MTEREDTYHVRLLLSLHDIDRDVWDGLANPEWRLRLGGKLTRSVAGEGASPELERPNFPFDPFICYDFLLALEQTGCTGPGSGWHAQHLLLEEGQDKKPVAVMPCYLKSHSQGEYVFDHGWAQAIHQAGGDYYPKIQCAVPFTPVPGRRFLTGGHPKSRLFANMLCSALIQLCDRHHAHSAHITFMSECEWQYAAKMDFLPRCDLQFHWTNREYQDFDGFLRALNTRKRKQIRKERIQAVQDGIEVEWIGGKDLRPEHWDAFYRCYLDTGTRKWGTPYLNREFFALLGEKLAERIVLIMARRHDRYIAGALNLVGSETLYGRYWGALEHHPCLHFEICYYQAIQYALAHDLKRVEAGAQGSHKLPRGYEPTTTFSAHYIAHHALRDAVEKYLEEERGHVAALQKQLAANGVYRS